MKETYLQYAQRKCKELEIFGLKTRLLLSKTDRNNYFTNVIYCDKLLGTIMFHTDSAVKGAFVNAKEPQLVEIIASFLSEDGVQLQGAKYALKTWYQEQLDKENDKI